MIRKITTLLAALAVVFTTLAPAAADARDRRDGYYSRDYGRHHRYRDRHDDGDAVAAGVVGLVLGLALGSMASQPNEPRYACRDRYQRCAPPPRPRCRERCDDGYYQDQRYSQDERYYRDDRGGAYEEEYGLEGDYDPRYDDRAPQCTRRERQWDRYANRYVIVDVPC